MLHRNNSTRSVGPYMLILKCTACHIEVFLLHSVFTYSTPNMYSNLNLY